MYVIFCHNTNLKFYSHVISIVDKILFQNFGMPEFSQSCTTNSLSNLNDASSNSNLQCGNSAHNVSNEGILSFLKNVSNS